MLAVVVIVTAVVTGVVVKGNMTLVTDVVDVAVTRAAVTTAYGKTVGADVYPNTTSDSDICLAPSSDAAAAG